MYLEEGGIGEHKGVHAVGACQIPQVIKRLADLGHLHLHHRISLSGLAHHCIMPSSHLRPFTKQPCLASCLHSAMCLSKATLCATQHL